MSTKDESSNLVFIAWSGETSHQLAKAFYDWIPKVIQAKPWMSDEDIKKGARWYPELSSRLEEANFGLICLTPENLFEPWIIFEAGALTKALRSFAWTLLFNVKTSDVAGPLAEFQHTSIKRHEIKKLMLDINNALGEKKQISEDIINSAFDSRWDELENILNKIMSSVAPGDETQKRPDREILEEILDLVREMPKRIQINYKFDSEKMLLSEIQRKKDTNAEIKNYQSLIKLLEK